MLNIRLEGDPSEAAALLDMLRHLGVNVHVGTVRARDTTWHTYAAVQAPDAMPRHAAPEVVRTGRMPGRGTGRRPVPRGGSWGGHVIGPTGQ